MAEHLEELLMLTQERQEVRFRTLSKLTETLDPHLLNGEGVQPQMWKCHPELNDAYVWWAMQILGWRLVNCRRKLVALCHKHTSVLCKGHLVNIGQYAYRPVKSPNFTTKQMRVRLQWCREHRTMTVDDWKKVFSFGIWQLNNFWQILCFQQCLPYIP